MGIDISEAMIAEARRNAELAGVSNASFERLRDYFARPAEPSLDFVHAYIVAALCWLGESGS